MSGEVKTDRHAKKGQKVQLPGAEGRTQQASQCHGGPEIGRAAQHRTLTEVTLQLGRSLSHPQGQCQCVQPIHSEREASWPPAPLVGHGTMRRAHGASFPRPVMTWISQVLTRLSLPPSLAPLPACHPSATGRRRLRSIVESVETWALGSHFHQRHSQERETSSLWSSLWVSRPCRFLPPTSYLNGKGNGKAGGC